MFPARDAPWYVRGMSVCAGSMLLVAVLAAVLRWHLVRENARRAGDGGGGYVGVGAGSGGKRRGRFEYML